MSVNVQCERCGKWFLLQTTSTVATAPPHTCIAPVRPERDYDDLLEFHSKTVTQYQQQCVEKDAEIARLREQRDAMDDYTIGLQRLIEALAHGHELREEGVAGTHLLDLAKKVRAEIARLQNKALAYAGISRRDADVVELVARRDDNKRLREALEDIASSGCCETPACSIETPLCHPMIARAALEVNDG